MTRITSTRSPDPSSVPGFVRVARTLHFVPASQHRTPDIPAPALPQTRNGLRALGTLFALTLAVGCSDPNGNGDGGTGGGMDGSATGMDGSATGTDGSATGTDGSTTSPSDGSVAPDGFITLPDGNVVPAGPVPCQGHIYQCGNQIDDDGDGLIDAEDPNCLGPCDNNESGLYLDIPGGDSAPCKLDCYYDQDQGSGNDQCEWDARCDPLMPDPDPHCAYEPPGSRGGSVHCPDPQAATCHDFCGPLTPNGCDCFGCCVRPGTTDDYRFIGSVDGTSGAPTCDIDTFRSGGDGCHPCTPVADCLNDCGHCELCLGRDASDLPSDCFPPPPPPPVDAGTLPDGGPAPVPDSGTPPPTDGGTTIDVCSDPTRQDCGVPGLPACPTGYFCITGCCTFFG